MKKPRANYYNVEISITKRYLTSLFSIRSYALLISFISISSISETILCSAQKSSISWVSAIPPIKEPARLFLPMIKPKPGNSDGVAGAPTQICVPFVFNKFINEP